MILNLYMKKLFLILVIFLIPNIVFAYDFSLKTEDRETIINIPLEFENLDEFSQSLIFKKTNNNYFNPDMSSNKGQHKIWIENDYFNKIDKKIFPNLILIRTNNKNIFTRDRFIKFIDEKLENQNLKKIWIDGHLMYVSIKEMNFNKDNYFVNTEENFYKHQIIILLPENRFSTIDLFLERKISITELENYIKMSPRISIQDLLDIYGEERSKKIFDDNFDKNINDYLLVNNNYYNIINNISAINTSLIEETLSTILNFQNKDLNAKQLNETIENSIYQLEIKINKAKEDYNLINRKNFSNFADGRYEYFLIKVENHINFLLDENINQKKSIYEILNYLNENPQVDLTNIIGKLYFSSTLNEVENTKYLIESQKNNIVSSNSVVINISNITSEIYQIYINYLEFIIDSYDYEIDYIGLFYLPVSRKNNSVFKNLDFEFETAKNNLIEYEEYMLNILNKLRNNKKILEIYSKMNNNLSKQLELLNLLLNQTENLHSKYPFISDYSDYSNFFEDFLILGNNINELLNKISLVQEDQRILAFEYSEEMSSL